MREGTPRRIATAPALDTLAIFALALAPRAWWMLHSVGGPGGIVGYDAGVYFTAADGFVHGRLPYADFVLLHPPGVMLALSPFAALAQLVSDHAAFMIANAAFEVLGAVNAVLVLTVARRLGCRRAAATLGAAFYALWFGAIDAEYSIRLEALGSFLLLTGLVLFVGRVRAPSAWRLGAAGAALGAAASVKIWWIVPLLLVLGWQVAGATRRRTAVPLGLGAAGALALLDGPFFVVAPVQMWHMVVTDQLGRHVGTSPIRRLDSLTSVQFAFPTLRGPGMWIAALAIVAMWSAAGVIAWRRSSGRRYEERGNTVPDGVDQEVRQRRRLVVVIAATQAAVLAAAPSYFGYYAGFMAAGLALVIALAADRPATDEPADGPTRRGPVVAAAAATVAAVLTAVTVSQRSHSVSPFPGSRLAAHVPRVRCVLADSPMALIELNVLSRDLRNGCPNWVDVTGRTYDVDAPLGHWTSRPHNPMWQADALAYLESGDAVILIRSDTGLDAATTRAIRRHRILERVGSRVVYTTH